MFFFIMISDYHVVNVNLYLVVYHVMEKKLPWHAISCTDILQTKRHNLVAESSPLCDEGYFLHILKCHFNLIILGETICDTVGELT